MAGTARGDTKATASISLTPAATSASSRRTRWAGPSGFSTCRPSRGPTSRTRTWEADTGSGVYVGLDVNLGLARVLREDGIVGGRLAHVGDHGDHVVDDADGGDGVEVGSPVAEVADEHRALRPEGRAAGGVDVGHLHRRAVEDEGEAAAVAQGRDDAAVSRRGPSRRVGQQHFGYFVSAGRTPATGRRVGVGAGRGIGGLVERLPRL